jgi:hypothetical protein
MIKSIVFIYGSISWHCACISESTLKSYGAVCAQIRTTVFV